jgi:tetratricopeptide (TPR) repeat protein
MLEEADMQEGAGRFDAAEALLKQVLDMDDEHLPSHERLKDLYLATDRRVDAVRELLWLAEAWGMKNRERAVQYAKAAHDLAPNAAATRASLRSLGIDPDHEKQDEVMFIDDSRATELARGEDNTGDASLDAILPPLSEPPASRSPARSASASKLERVTRSTIDRPAQEDPLDIPLSPDDFDGPTPEPLRTITKSSVQALLERPIMPEEFELEPEPAPRAPIAAPGSKAGVPFGSPAGMPYGAAAQAPNAKISSVLRQSQDTGPLYPSRPPLESSQPARSGEGRGGQVEADFDDMQALLDAPISPDEFDAPPPRREAGSRPNTRADMGALLDQPLPPDDFGLSDERFERSGLIDVEEPPRPSVAPRAASTVPPGKAMRAQMLERAEDDDEPSIEFAEINTGEVDVAADGDLDDAANSTMVEDGLAEQLANAQRGNEFTDLGTGEIVTIQSDVPPRPAAPPPFQKGAVPASTQLKVDLKPPVPVPPAGAFKAKPAPAPLAKDETDWSDLDFDAQPEPTVRGEPIPELVRQSMRGDMPTPGAVPVLPAVARDEVEDLFVVPESMPPPASTPTPVPMGYDEPQPREEPTATLSVEPEKFEDTEEVVFTQPPPSRADQPVAEALPPELEEVLDEAAFFSSQGMHDEALEAIQEAILIYPKYKVLKDKLAEYEAKADAKEAQEEAKADLIEDDSFDIAQQLATELSEPSGEAAGQEMVDVESVFAQFKKGVAQQISVDDSDTHFDLGIAYKEMGLIDDAMQEFETAALGSSRACTALTMVGMCCLEKGDVPGAVAQFERALASKAKSAAEELALYYEIGNAYELMGQLDRAASCFEKVIQRDRTFRGVTTRLEQLKKRGTKSAGAIG